MLKQFTEKIFLAEEKNKGRFSLLKSPEILWKSSFCRRPSRNFILALLKIFLENENQPRRLSLPAPGG